MSKYIKLDDIKTTECCRNINCDRCVFNTGLFFCRLRIWVESLPTIEVSEDTISRAYVLERANEWGNMYPDSDAAREALSMLMNEIDNAPSVIPSRPQGEWVTDKLPTDGDTVLITYDGGKNEPILTVVSAYVQQSEDESIHFFDTGYGEMWYGVWGENVRAWMPLPEPWKGADDE